MKNSLNHYRGMENHINMITYEGFDHIGRQIFKNVDVWTLIKARRVCQSWKQFIDYEMLYHISSQLTEECTKKMFQTKAWRKILRDIWQGKNKEDTKQYFDFLKNYWVLPRLECARFCRSSMPLYAINYIQFCVDL